MPAVAKRGRRCRWPHAPVPCAPCHSRPASSARRPGPVYDCRIDLSFGEDELVITTQGACGVRLDGRYLKRTSPSAAWGTQ